MPQIEARTREDIAAFLPGAIQSALASYISFSMDQATTPNEKQTSKEFKDHHDACKIAIAHLKLLIDLAKWADLPTPEMQDEVQQSHLAALINAANAELGR